MGKGSGGSTPSQQVVNTSSIPSYMQPYVEDYLGRAQALTTQNTYQPYAGQRVAGFTPMQTQAFENVANQQVAGQIGEASNLASQAGQTSMGAWNQGQQLGQAGLGYGGMGAGYGAQGAQTGLQGGAQYGGMGAGLGLMAAGAGQNYANMATNPAAQQAYMSPYIQNALQPQLEEMQRQYAITGAQEQGAATRAGAYGGNREALMRSENQRNKNMAMNQAIGTGYQNAFNAAQQAQQFGANLGLQGMQTGIQGAQTGLQGVNAQLAGTAQGMQGAQTGLQGVGAATQAGQYGLQGLSQANQAASTLGALGQTQFQQQSAINQAMANAGAQQQALQQQGLTNQYQDYLENLNYPYKQLSFMQGMTSGLPMSQTAQTMYQQTPNNLTQTIGAAGTLYGASRLFKEGGEVKGIKAYAGDQGSVVESMRAKLESLADAPGGIAQLEKIKASSSSMEMRKLAAEVIMEKQMEMQADKSVAPPPPPPPQIAQAPAQSQGIAAAPAPSMDGMAGGGIIAFADEGKVEDPDLKELNAVRKMREAAGVTGTPNEAYKKFFEQQVAGLPEQKEQAKGQMIFDYFSNLGTQTGPTGFAALKAARESSPLFKATMESVRKAEKDVMKGQAELDQADRLEKLGMVDKANDIRQKQLDREKALEVAKIQANATMASANRATDLDRDAKAYFDDLVKNNGMDPKDPATMRIAREKARQNANPYAQGKLDIATEAAITNREKVDTTLKGLQTQLIMADEKDKAAIQQQIEARRAEIRNEISKGAGAPGSPKPGAGVVTPTPVPPNISSVKGAPAGSSIGKYVEGQGYEIRDKDGKLIGFAK